MRLNKIHLVPVYSYLIEILTQNFDEWNFRERDRNSTETQLFSEQNLVAFVPCRLLSRFCYPRALTPLCFKVLPARVCSVNLRLLTHTTPLFCFFYFKLLFSKTLGLVVIIYSCISIETPLGSLSLQNSTALRESIDALKWKSSFLSSFLVGLWRNDR